MEDLNLEAVSVLNVSAGDTIVLRINGRVSQEVRQDFVAKVGALLPDGVKVMVLDDTVSLSVIKLTDTAAA